MRDKDPRSGNRTFRDWYEENSATLSAKRKKAYRDNPEVREAAKARAQQNRQRRKEGVPVQRVLYRTYNGDSVPVYSTGYVASELGCSPTLLLGWEKRGWIPEPVFNEAHRLYLKHQVTLIRKLYTIVQEGKAKRIAKAVETIHDNW